MSDKIDKLAELSNKAKELIDIIHVSDDKFDYEQLENYVNEVARLEGEFGTFPKELLIEFKNNHSELLNVVENSKDKLGSDLRTLVKKGKGLKAYVDLLPKRVSMNRVKKG